MDFSPTAIIALRGWHPALARAEAKAMFSNSKVERTDARRLLTASGESNWENARIMAGCECVLVGGGIAKWESIENLLELIVPDKIEDMAVECWRHEGKIPVATREIERHIGGLFHDAGSSFDLDNPTKRFGVVLDNSAGYVAWGWMIGQGPGKQGWAAMRANKRPFFRPVSLEPRLARAAVNIAAGTKNGHVIDPMCGTGGILIESALSNRPTLGIDFDPVMIAGCQENIDWAKVEAELVRADATRFQFPSDFSAVVVDPPYGRNSPSDERLIRDLLANIRNQSDDCTLVVILPVEAGGEDLDEEVSTNIELPGFKIEAAFGIPVHKSLGRVLIVASCQN